MSSTGSSVSDSKPPDDAPFQLAASMETLLISSPSLHSLAPPSIPMMPCAVKVELHTDDLGGAQDLGISSKNPDQPPPLPSMKECLQSTNLMVMDSFLKYCLKVHFN